jgi:hypothetical protein
MHSKKHLSFKSLISSIKETFNLIPDERAPQIAVIKYLM